MKIQVAFDMPEIEQALALASLLQSHIDIVEIGTLLIYKHGTRAIKLFREALPHKVILADIKIADRGKEAAKVCFHAGADWVTVLAGTSKSVIHAAAVTAHEMGKFVMLDLIDSSSPGQSALEASGLGIDALLFHKPVDDEDNPSTLIDQWEMVRGNTHLPIFVSAPITHETAVPLIQLKPEGLVLGKTVTEAPQPLEELQAFIALIQK